MYIRRLRITKLVFSVILLLFLYNSLGYFFIFKCIQSDLKSQVAQNLQFPKINNPLKTFAFHKNDLKTIEWVEENKEMRYNGELYDVARIIETGDSIVYYCIGDEDEDRLYSQLNDHITNHVIAPAQTHSSKKIMPEPVKVYISNEHLCSFNLYFISFLPHVSTIDMYLPIYIEMNLPPPKFS